MFIRLLLTFTGSSPEGIAVDSVAKLLFYTDNGRNTVNVVRIDNGDHKVLVAYARHPRAIQVDPINRYSLHDFVLLALPSRSGLFCSNRPQTPLDIMLSECPSDLMHAGM